MSSSLPSDHKNGFLRRLALAALWIGVGVAALIMAGLWALQLPGTQRAILAKMVSVVETRTGLEVSANALRIGWKERSLEFDGLSLGLPGKPPFLTARTVRAEVKLLSLLGARPTLPLVVADELRLDLEAPLPAGGEPTAENEPPAIDLLRVQIHNGSIRGQGLPEPARNWLSSWSAARIDLEGGLVQGELTAELTGALLETEQGRLEPLALQARGSATGPISGPWLLSEITLKGDDVDARFGGRLGAGPDAPLEGSFRIAVSPSNLLAHVSGDDSLLAVGEFDLPGKSATVEVEVTDLPGSLLADLLGDDAPPPLRAVETSFDLGTRIRIAGDRVTDLSGTASVAWKGRDASLLEATLVAPPGQAGSDLRVTIEAEVLSSQPGRRHLRGDVLIAEIRDPSTWIVDSARLAWQTADLGTDAELLGTLWPEAVTATTTRSLAGPLRSETRLSGPLMSPEIEAQGVWIREDDTELSFKTRYANRVLEIHSVSLERGESVADVQGQILLQPFLAAGSGTLGLRQPAGPVDEAQLEFTLDQGLLDLQIEEILIGGNRAYGRARIPLASAFVLASGSAPPEFASGLARARGPVELNLEAEDAEWRPLVEDLAGGPLAASIRAGGRVNLSLDPSSPVSSHGELEVSVGITAEDGSQISTDGPLRLVLENGTLSAPPTLVQIDGESMTAEGSLELQPRWRIADGFAGLIDRASLDISGHLAATTILRQLPGCSGEGRLGVELGLVMADSSPRGNLRLTGPGLVLACDSKDSARVEISSPSADLKLLDHHLRLVHATATLNGGSIEMSGEAWLERPLSRASLLASIQDAFPPLEGIELQASLAEGILEVRSPRFSAGGVPGSFEATAPLQALADTPGLQAFFSDLPLLMSSGDVELIWSVPETDWASLLAQLGVTNPPSLLRMGTQGALSLNPARPLQAQGAAQVNSFRVEMGDYHAEAEDTLWLDLADGRLTLEPASLQAQGEALQLAGEVELGSALGDGGRQPLLIRHLDLRANGSLPATLLRPFLAGGAIAGVLRIKAEIEGPPDSLSGRLLIHESDASLIYAYPYTVRIERPQTELLLTDGEIRFTDGRLLLNGGAVELSGAFPLTGGGDLRARIRGSRFLLDYGLLAILDGDLRLHSLESGQWTLGGELIVDRGVLTRSMQVNRSFIAELLTPIDLTGSEASALEQIALNLTIATRHGALVKNNVADMRLRWEPLRVRGTLAAPLTEGRIDIDPGGLAFLYGQTFRLDRAVVILEGVPDAEPKLELELTSSLEDPSIGRLRGTDPFAVEQTQDPSEDPAGELTRGIATYYGEQVATRLSQSLAGTEISLRPILVFGETDPEARLTISRQVSTNFAVAASIDLRNAEQRTYLLDAHDIPLLPRVSAQIFTNDQGNEGATLQQRLEWGGGRKGSETHPRVRKVRFDRPAGLSKRGMRRAIGYEKGDPLSPDAPFLIEVEVGDYLRFKGYPDARVEVVQTEFQGRRRKVDLQIRIQPGPHIRFVWDGKNLPKALKRRVTELYRADFYEPTSLTEMQAQLTRALRDRGFLQPTVEIDVRPTAPSAESADRTVTLRTAGGERIKLKQVLFTGLPAEEAAWLSARFPTQVQRMELAAAEPEADRRLLGSLRSLAYVEPTIRSRELTPDNKVLQVEVEAIGRRRLASIRLSGEPEGVDLTPSINLEKDNPARSDRIAEVVLALENRLKEAGFRKAAVQAQVEPATVGGPGQPSPDLDLTFVVDAGQRTYLSNAEFTGLGASRQAWATSVAALERGSLLTDTALMEARRRLWKTGVFAGVLSTVEEEDTLARVLFDLEENRRFSVAWGLRWETQEGMSAVVDAADNNFLGRGFTLGARALYSSDDESLRLRAILPRVIGSEGALELFALLQNRLDAGFDETTREGTVQIAYPFGQRFTGRIYGRWRQVDLLDTEEDPFGFPPQEFRFSRPLLGLQLLFDSRNDPLDSVRGTFASIDLSWSGKPLGADLPFLRLFSQINHFRPAGTWRSRRLTWAQSLQLGLAEAYDMELDRPDRFFAGGAYSVRGYPTESLGPIEVLGPIERPLGGEALLVLNEELRLELLERLSALIFLDAGNVWASPGALGSDLFLSTGLGLRVRSPVGLLRLDVAFPLDRRELDPDYRIHFGFGHVF